MEITGIVKRRANGYFAVDYVESDTGEYGIGPDAPGLYQDVLDYIELYPDRVIPHPDDDMVFVEKRDALSRLDELDKIVPRVVEDLYFSTGLTPYARTADAIAEKQELRAKLSQVEK